MAKFNSSLVALAFSVVIFAGCTRESKTTDIQFTAPVLKSGKLTYAKVAKKTVSASSDSGGGFNDLLNPTTTAELNCFVVFVGGTGFDQKGVCQVSDGSVLKVGAFAGGLQAGQSVSLSVPSGERQIALLGFQMEDAALCGDFKSGMPMAKMSEPFIVAKKSQNLSGGTVSVDLTPSLTVNKVEDCEFASDDGTQSGGYFGSGSDGDYNGSGSLDLMTAMNASSQYYMSQATVTAISDNGNGTGQITVNGNWNMSSKVNVKDGDEVMLYIAGGTTPGCGDVFPGFSISGRASNTTTGTIPGSTFTLSIGDDRWFTIPAASLTATASDVSTQQTFCRVVAVRVPHFNSITASSSLLMIRPSSAGTFSFGTLYHSGFGLLPIRVKTAINAPSGRSIDFDVAGRGYAGASSGQQRGQGSLGWLTGTGSSLGSHNSAGGYWSVGGCGGGHGGTGGCANASGSGQIEGDEYGCSVYDATRSCLSGKFFFGGGGGMDSAAGGAGGGALRIYAKSIVADGGITVFADGSAAASLDDAGGAGGSAYLVVDSLSGPGDVTVVSRGGDGNGLGGVGGGGRIHIKVKDSSTFSGTVSGNAAAGVSGDTTNASPGTCKADGIVVSGCP